MQVKLALISAPPGFGKTILAAQYAQRATVPVAWHAIGERERNLAALHNHSLAVLETLAPGISEAVPLTENAPPEELAALATGYLEGALRDDAVYILDDEHHLATSSLARRWLRAFVDSLPQRLHLIVASRQLPDLPLLELIGYQAVLPFRQTDLRLTEEEITEIAIKLRGHPPSQAEMDWLLVRLEGWPAGVALALQPNLPALDSKLMDTTVPPSESLFVLLADHMLAAQPPRVRDFLLASSTLARLTPQMCQEMLGLSDSRALLAEIEARNLFLTRLPDGLVYHTLFRDFLQRTLRDDSPQRYLDLHGLAARWFASHDAPEAAFDHYMQASLPEEAAALADSMAPIYYGQGQHETLIDWLHRLETSSVEPPLLAYTCGMIFSDQGDYVQAESALAQAEKVLRASADANSLARVQLQQARINLQTDDYPHALALVTPLLSSEDLELRGRALRVAGLVNVRHGEVTVGVEQLETASTCLRQAGLISSLSHVLQDLHFAYSRLGKLDQASAHLHELVAIRRKLKGRAGLALALNNLGYYYYQCSDYPRASETLEEGLKVIAGLGNVRTEAYLLWSLADLKRDLSRFLEAQQLYEQALVLATAEDQPALRSAILTGFSTLRSRQGRWEEALALAEEASDLADAHGIAHEAINAQAARWIASAYLADPVEALDGLQEVAERLRELESRYELVGVLGACARLAAQHGDSQQAADFLREAVSTAKVVGSAQPLAVEVAHSAVLESLLEDMGGQNGLRHDLERLDAARGGAQRQPLSAADKLEQPVFALQVRALGRESVACDGEPVPDTSWRAAGAKELFFYLLFCGPQTRADVGLVFWPESDDQQVRDNFHTTVRRIRLALVDTVIEYDRESGIYQINPYLSVWCDAIEFEHMVHEARLLAPYDPRAEDLLHRAVGLYQGRFMPTSDKYDWVFARRRALEELHVEALAGLGDTARARQDYPDALDAYGRALDADPYREEVHRAVMQCYLEMGEPAHMLTHYERLSRLLQDELGVSPAAETQALAQKLLDRP